MEEWFKEWFASDLYLTVYNHRDETDAIKLCNLIVKATKLKRHSKILDAACGSGRHANYFSSLGHDVTGFDLSKTLLKYAVRNLSSANLNAKYFCADIRNPGLKYRYDLVVNLFTSFGYFIDDEQNFLFIKNAYSLLNSDGFYVLDYLNPDYLKNNLVVESNRVIEDIFINETRKIIGNRIEKEIVITANGLEKKFRESVSLYSKDFLISRINEIGFKLENLFGDYNENNFEQNKSPRMILIFRK